MADFVCPQCGAQFTPDVESEAEGAYCPDCGAFCAEETFVPVVTDVEVIDVQAEPVRPGGSPDPIFRQARVRAIRYQGQVLEGQGCCCLGCFGVAFLAFLLMRGLLSLF